MDFCGESLRHYKQADYGVLQSEQSAFGRLIGQQKDRLNLKLLL